VRENVCECVRVWHFFYPISVYLASVFLPLFQSHSIFLILKTHLLFSFPACLMRPLSTSFEWDSALAAAVWSLGYFSDDRSMDWQLLDSREREQERNGSAAGAGWEELIEDTGLAATLTPLD
jgi:hypothetical protein